MFESYGGDRYIVQCVGLSESPDQESPNSNIDSHVVVFAKVEDEWYILDVGLEEPFNITLDPKGAIDWLVPIDYMNVFTLEIKGLSYKRSTAMIEQWDRIMKGEPARKKGGNNRKLTSTRY